MKLRETCKYAIACPTSMGVRITPENRMAVHNSNLFVGRLWSSPSRIRNIRYCYKMTSVVIDFGFSVWHITPPRYGKDR